MTESDKHIVPGDMPFEKAATILARIVDTHEDIVAQQQDLSHIAGVPIDKLRQAERVVTDTLMAKHGGVPIGSRDSSLLMQKDGLWGGTLDLYLPNGSVQMTLTDWDDNFVLRNEFPFTEPRTDFQRQRTQFADYRSQPPTISSLADLGDDPNQEKLKHMTRGLRWMNANMLTWEEPRVIMPEQLDQIPLFPGIKPLEIKGPKK